VGFCLVNCCLQMGQGLVIVYVIVLPLGYVTRWRQRAAKFIAHEGHSICMLPTPSPTCLVKNAHMPSA
jgi:hypothetical protein